MNHISYIALLVAAVFTGTQANADFLNGNAQRPDQNICEGWASEINEISGALHEQLDGQRETVSTALYDLETLVDATCTAEKSLDFEISEKISKVATTLRKELLENNKTKKAERTLASTLLKLIERSSGVTLTMGS